MNYLSRQSILEIVKLIKEHDSNARKQKLFGIVQDLGKLDSALHAPKLKLYGKEQYPSLTEKAAVLFYEMIKAHWLVDGNKRTGVMALYVFLLLNNIELTMSKKDLYNLSKSVAASTIDPGKQKKKIEKKLAEGIRDEKYKPD